MGLATLISKYQLQLPALICSDFMATVVGESTCMGSGFHSKGLSWNATIMAVISFEHVLDIQYTWIFNSCSNETQPLFAYSELQVPTPVVLLDFLHLDVLLHLS
jgi:hypothetical protein